LFARSLVLLLFGGPAWAGGSAPAAPPPTTAAAPAARALRFNGVPARAQDLAVIARFEAAWGQAVPDGAYWYDNLSGAAGQWGGPARGFLGAGLDLGGVPVPADASGGGDGRLTGVFINGRELHPLDVSGLTSLLGSPPWPGKWWVDAQGNFGMPGQPPAGNLVVLMSQRKGAGGSYYRSDVGTGSSTFVGSGCAAVSGRTNPSDSSSSTYSYYVGCD
jgi:hypothetical protein